MESLQDVKMGGHVSMDRENLLASVKEVSGILMEAFFASIFTTATLWKMAK